MECLAELAMTRLLTYLLLIHKSAELSFPILYFLCDTALFQPVSYGLDSNDVTDCQTVY